MGVILGASQGRENSRLELKIEQPETADNSPGKRFRDMLVTGLMLSGLSSHNAAGRTDILDLARLPALPIVAPAHLGEIELHWECGHLIAPPSPPSGWAVEIDYTENAGSLRVHYAADVIALDDFVPIPPDAMPSTRIRATADCFDYTLNVPEGMEGSTRSRCGGALWTLSAASPTWKRAECVE